MIKPTDVVLRVGAPIDWVHSTFWCLILGACTIIACAATFGGCVPPGGAESPDRATARASILLVAKGVKEADAMCAKFALDTKDVSLAKNCADIYDLARPSLIGSEAAVDGWNDSSKGQLACLAIDSIVALESFAKVLGQAKLALPLIIVDSLKLADAFKGLCPHV